jgi:carbon storage regulator
MSFLILTRRVGEEILIDNPSGQIKIMVTKIDGDRVKVGIDAPRDIRVNRKEVVERENRDNTKR